MKALEEMKAYRSHISENKAILMDTISESFFHRMEEDFEYLVESEEISENTAFAMLTTSIVNAVYSLACGIAEKDLNKEDMSFLLGTAITNVFRLQEANAENYKPKGKGRLQ